MTASNTYGRQVVIPLTNKSGGGVIAGDVVIVDTTNNDAFTTTTSAGFTGGVGVAQETIASNGTGRVLTQGYAALVNVNASVTRGNFGKTHTVAKQATDAGATRGVGTFCQFLTGGTTPDALVFPVDLLGSSLTNPMTTKGDVILGDTGGTPSRLGAGTAGYVLTSNGAAAFPSWQAAGSLSENFITGDVTMTNANTFYDGPSLSLAAGTYLLVGSVLCYGSGGGLFSVKLWDGASSVLDNPGHYEATSGGQENVAVQGMVTIGSTTTYKISVALTTTGGTIMATPTNNGTTNKASHLVALKIA